jgi:hypothetical protein
MPISLANIGWKTYMINGSWDVIMFGLILYWWVETKGRTLEEVDEAIEGVKHSDVPNINLILKGKEELGEVEVRELGRGRGTGRGRVEGEGRKVG